MSVQLADRKVLLRDNELLWGLLRGLPFRRVDRNLIEEAHYEGAAAFSILEPRKTGEPAFAHSQRTALRVARVMEAAGYFRAEPIQAALLHDVPEDTDAATPYANPLEAYYRMPDRYGEVLARILYLVSRGKRMARTDGKTGQSEEEHLEQLDAGEEFFYRQMKQVLENDRIRTPEERIMLQVAAVVYTAGWIIRKLFGREAPRRYPLPRSEWILFIARVVKVCDRLDNLETYIHPVVYGRRLDHLRYKLGLTKQYYVSIAQKALESAPAAFRGPVAAMCAELDQRIAGCELYLARVEERLSSGELRTHEEKKGSSTRKVLVDGTRDVLDVLEECREGLA